MHRDAYPPATLAVDKPKFRAVPPAGPVEQASHVAVLRQALTIFAPLALLAACVLYLLYTVQSAALLSVTRAREETSLATGLYQARGELASVVSDLRYLAGQETLAHWLATANPAARRALAADYLAFARAKAGYDQIRLIDAAGREVVRVNQNDGNPSVVADEALQDKSARPYVSEGLALGPGKVYVSAFDLNVEGGAIERPIKPMIRFATPVSGTSGETRGLIAMNYLGRRLLDRIAAPAAEAPGDIWLLNTEGYWLRGPSAEDEWAFQYPGRSERSFARAYPQAWSRIEAGGPKGQFDNADGLFSYARFAPLPAAVSEAAGPGGRGWILVRHLPPETLAALRGEPARDFLVAALVLALLLAAVAGVTARHRAGRQLAEQRLRASETRFRSLLEAAPDPVVAIDPEGRIVLVNARTEQVFGHSRDSLIGRAVEVLVPERFRERHRGHRSGYAQAPKVRPMGAGLELYGLRADGSEFPVSISLSPVETEDGRLFVSDIRDVSDRLAAEREIRSLNERLRQDNASLETLNEELEAFSYSVSHDLRAPLRSIDGFSQALLEDCADRLDEDGRDHLNRVRRAAQRMGLLIDDLLKLSRVTRSSVKLEDVDLGALAGDIMSGLREGEPERQVESAIAPGLSARGDPQLLRIALQNLLDNAWKFTAGRAPARIEVGRQAHDGATAYFVRDNGVGFDMAYVDQLFRAFQRLHDARDFPGTGIGLATVQRIIHKHGGRIWAESTPGEGTTVFFTLTAQEGR